MPDAPPPTYDSTGSLVAGWWVRAGYDPSQDEIVVTWHQDAGTYTESKTVEERHPFTDVEDVIASLQRRIRILGARRLF